MDRCPACRARLDGRTTCPRCGCDLGLARRAERQAEAQGRLALAAWLAGEPGQAAEYARAATKQAATPLQKALARWFAARA